MNADEYWARRSREREAEWFKKSQQTVEKELAAEYERSLQRLTQKVEALYGRFATENGLTMAEAVKLISGPEYKAWRMDIEDYVKQIGKTGDKGLLRELNTLSMRSRISRLDKLRGETLMELDKLGRKVDSSMTKFLSDAYTDTKRQTLGDLAKQGINSLATEVSPERVKDVLKTPWSGKNYSERIWKNTTKLADTIQTEIVNGVHRGSSVQSMTKRVQEHMGVGRSDSERLVRTEMNYVNNTAALDSMREAKMKYFRFIATIDRRTSAICREHDGNLYELDEAAVGDNVPPLHARCRSTIAASLEGPEKVTNTSKVKEENAKGSQVKRSVSTVTVKTDPVTTDMIRGQMQNIDLQNAAPKDIIDLGKMVVEKHNIVDIVGDKEALAEVFSEYREIGSTIPKTMWSERSNPVNKKLLQGAFDVYPSAWLDYVKKDNRKFFTPKVKRGFFVPGATKDGKYYYDKLPGDLKDDYLTIAMNGERKTTAFHEIGHMVEHYNKDALRISHKWIKERTEGEDFVRLMDLFPGYNYGHTEMTKADNFISPYIGKETAGSEVLSMGLESLFEPQIGQEQKIINGKIVYKKITDDEEYLHLIVGLILKA